MPDTSSIPRCDCVDCRRSRAAEAEASTPAEAPAVPPAAAPEPLADFTRNGITALGIVNRRPVGCAWCGALVRRDTPAYQMTSGSVPFTLHSYCARDFADSWTPCGVCEQRYWPNSGITYAPSRNSSGRAPTVCPTCQPRTTRCPQCHYNELTEHMVEWNGYRFCRACRQRNVVACADCQAEMLRTESYERPGGTRCCYACWQRTMENCDACGTASRRPTTRRSALVAFEHETRGTLRLCATCHAGVAPCPLCNSPTVPNLGCARCVRGEVERYTYRPAPEFQLARGERLPAAVTEEELEEAPICFLAYELEVERNRSPLAIEQVVGWLRTVRPEVYCKSDGSLQNGVEIVSHPFTYGWLTEHAEELKAAWTTLARAGYRSYETGTCGLHVHLSKAAFTSLRLYKFMKLVYEPREFSMWLNQREDTYYCSLTSEPTDCLPRKAKHRNSNLDGDGDLDGSRYVAVNLEHEATVEVRMFRGTLNPASFMKALEYCYALYEYSGEAAIPDCTARKFMRWVEQHAKRFPHLAAYLAQRVRYLTDAPETAEREIASPKVRRPRHRKAERLAKVAAKRQAKAAPEAEAAPAVEAPVVEAPPAVVPMARRPRRARAEASAPSSRRRSRTRTTMERLAPQEPAPEPMILAPWEEEEEF